MTRHRRGLIECLCCGQTRIVSGRPRETGECPRCSYLGWAYSTDLSETERRMLRERPLESPLRYASATR